MRQGHRIQGGIARQRMQAEVVADHHAGLRRRCRCPAVHAARRARSPWSSFGIRPGCDSSSQRVPSPPLSTSRGRTGADVGDGARRAVPARPASGRRGASARRSAGSPARVQAARADAAAVLVHADVGVLLGRRASARAAPAASAPRIAGDAPLAIQTEHLRVGDGHARPARAAQRRGHHDPGVVARQSPRPRPGASARSARSG